MKSKVTLKRAVDRMKTAQDKLKEELKAIREEKEKTPHTSEGSKEED